MVMGLVSPTSQSITTGERAQEPRLDALIEKLAAAVGWDQSLDLEIALARGWQQLPANVTGARLKDWAGAYHYTPSLFTGSVDAALTLLPKGVWLLIETGTQSNGSDFEWPVVAVGSQKTGDVIWKGQAKTIPLAICIAAFEAASSQVGRPR